MYLKTKDLCSEFGFCKKVMLSILKDMNASGFEVIAPSDRTGTYRADPEQVKNYLLGKKANDG